MNKDDRDVVIEAANTEDKLRAVRELWIEYWTALNLEPEFQGFVSEVAGLPGKYAPPSGRLGLALVAGEPAGTVALRRLDGTRSEAKRLFVRPQYRSLGLGRKLLDWLIAEARAAGYREMYWDTLPSMSQALAMYAAMGVEPAGPYTEDPTPGALYFRLRL